MMNSRTYHLTLSAMFMALGILIPLLFHAAGLGSLFLPMFWPVAISAFFLPFHNALAVGGLTPILSSLLTGMPPISPPIVHIMVLELLFLAGTTCFVYQKTSWGIFWPLAIGVTVSRFILFLFAGFLAPILGLPPEIVSLGSVIKGVPGVIAMMICVPLLLKRIKFESIFRTRKSHVPSS